MISDLGFLLYNRDGGELGGVDKMEGCCDRGEVVVDGSEKEGSDLLSSPLENTTHDPLDGKMNFFWEIIKHFFINKYQILSGNFVNNKGNGCFGIFVCLMSYSSKYKSL